MSVIWRKVWRDLTHNKLRTLLAGLSIAAGIFALGLALGARELTQTLVAEDMYRARPAQIAFRGGTFNADTFDRQVEKVVRKEPGVAEVENELTAAIRWRRPGETAWRQGILIAREDYPAQNVSQVDLLSGQWPDDDLRRGALAVERQTAVYYNLSLGGTIIVKLDRGERELPLQGVVRKPYVLPPMYGAPGTFYATTKTILRLTGSEGFNKLYVRLKTEESTDIALTTRQLRNKLERMGLVVNGTGPAGIIGEFNMDDMQGQMDALYLILIVLGALALGLSAFLIVNTTSAIIVQQVWQIGVMKTLGGTFSRVVQVYLVMALAYGGLGFAIALVPSAVAAQAMAQFLLDSTLNILPGAGTLRFSQQAIVCQVGISLLVPLVSALVPIVGGARLTPREAISTRGVGLDFGASRLDRLISLWHGLPRPLALSLRNAFRRKTRVALTIVALVFGGLIFMTVISVQTSMVSTVEQVIEGMRYDLTGMFATPQNIGTIKDLAATVPEIMQMELWDRRDAQWENAQGDRVELSVWGIPMDSQVLHPILLAGRGLVASDDRAVLLDNNTASRNRVSVGDDIVLTIAGKDAHWQVVGLIVNVLSGTGDCYVPLSALKSVTGGDRANVMMAITSQHDGQTQARVIEALNATFLAHHIEVISYRSAEQFREQSLLLFSTVSGLLLTMAFVSAVVGGLGLAGILSISVLERQREIGVMRAIGASSSTVRGIFVGEGICLGLVSWLIALPLSYPASYYFGRALEVTLFHTPLAFDYSWLGAGLWLVIVVVLSAFASLWPAVQATRVTVREALVYE